MTSAHSTLRPDLGWFPGWSALCLAAVLMVMGVLHLVVPAPFERIVPRLLGSPRPWVTTSGLVEIGTGAALLAPATRRLGGWVAAALMVAVFPANVQMAVDAGAPDGLYATAAWLRLPLQIPLILWALRAGRARTTGPLA